MGTWDAGPFSNDAAMDFVGDVIDNIAQPIHDFMAEPLIDEGFDEAFAAVAMLNSLMPLTGAQAWHNGDTLDGKPVREALLKCYDEQIDDLDPDPDFKAAQRKQLVAVL